MTAGVSLASTKHGRNLVPQPGHESVHRFTAGRFPCCVAPRSIVAGCHAVQALIYFFLLESSCAAGRFPCLAQSFFVQWAILGPRAGLIRLVQFPQREFGEISFGSQHQGLHRFKLLPPATASENSSRKPASSAR